MATIQDYEFAGSGIDAITNAILGNRMRAEQARKQKMVEDAQKEMVELRRSSEARQAAYQQGMLNQAKERDQMTRETAAAKAAKETEIQAATQRVLGSLTAKPTERWQTNEVGEPTGVEQTVSTQTDPVSRMQTLFDALSKPENKAAFASPLIQKLPMELEKQIGEMQKRAEQKQQPDLPPGMVPMKASETASGRRVEYGLPPKEYTEVDRETAGKFGWLIDAKGEWHLKHETKTREDLTKAQTLTALQRILTEANRMLRDDPTNRIARDQRLDANQRIWGILEGRKQEQSPSTPAAPATQPKAGGLGTKEKPHPVTSQSDYEGVKSGQFYEWNGQIRQKQ